MLLTPVALPTSRRISQIHQLRRRRTTTAFTCQAGESGRAAARKLPARPRSSNHAPSITTSLEPRAGAARTGGSGRHQGMPATFPVAKPPPSPFRWSPPSSRSVNLASRARPGGGAVRPCPGEPAPAVRLASRQHRPAPFWQGVLLQAPELLERGRPDGHGTATSASCAGRLRQHAPLGGRPWKMKRPFDQYTCRGNGSPTKSPSSTYPTSATSCRRLIPIAAKVAAMASGSRPMGCVGPVSSTSARRAASSSTTYDHDLLTSLSYDKVVWEIHAT